MAQLHARVLIIDDEPSNLLLLEAFLADTATEVRGLKDSRQVEEVFKEFEPDIVLLDLHMPAVDGLEVLRRLSSARESLGFLPVIVLTADSSRVARNSALLLGANDFLIKPLDRTEVVLRVRNLLHTRELFVDLAEATRLLESDQKSGSRGLVRASDPVAFGPGRTRAFLRRNHTLSESDRTIGFRGCVRAARLAV